MKTVRSAFATAILLARFAVPAAAEPPAFEPGGVAVGGEVQVDVRCPTCIDEGAKPDAPAAVLAEASPLAASGATSTLFVPVILSALGAGTSFYTTELTFTNKGTTPAGIELTYTSASGGGDGTVTDTLGAGRQKIVPDAVAYLSSLGLSVPAQGAVGTLRVRFTGLSSPAEGTVIARTTTRVPEGRAGLAYPGTDTSLISAGASLPDSSALTSGTFRPTNYGGSDAFPAPAPAPSTAKSLATFDGSDPNGAWSLYLVDDTNTDSGRLANGWCVNVATTTQATPQPFCTSESITIPGSGSGATTGAPASIYPSTVTVSGLSGTVTKVTVSLRGFSHYYPDDVDALLAGPAGRNLVVLSDVGGGTDANALNITIDDAPPLAVWLCGLRQNASDRSNVAATNPGAAGEGDVVLRATVYSGGSVVKTLPDQTLAPGQFHQWSGILGDTPNGYVKVERVGGSGRFLSYGVVNDQGTSDGSFVPAMEVGANAGKKSLVLPVLVEAGAFTSELVLTNVSSTSRNLTLLYVADAVGGGQASVSLALAAGEQRVIPSYVQWLREQNVAGVGPVGTTFAGALFVSVTTGDLANVFVGARTSSAGGAGRYGLFYTAVPAGGGFETTAWLYGLQQNGENRTNLALVNTGEKDSTEDVFKVELFDGETGQPAGTVTDVKVGAKKWTQIGAVLAQGSAGLANAYAKITRTSGKNPFLVYAVVNDGASAGQRSGDGAYVIPAIDCTYSVSGTGRTFGWSGGSSSTSLTATAGCPWGVASDSSWLSVSSAASGTGNATVEYRVAANESASSRTGGLTIAGKAYTVTQLGNAPGAYDGSWSGTTSQSKPISFTVLKNEITQLGMGISATLYPCSVNATFTGVEVTPHPAVSGNAFSMSPTISGGGGAFLLNLSGTFGSASNASGTASVPLIITGSSLCLGSGGSVSWTATRQ